MLADAWRLAVGTLTALPVSAPTTVDRRRAGLATLLAPLATVILGIAAGVVFWGGGRIGLSPLVAALLVVGVVALGDRAFHLDGLADVADGLTASYDRERSLQVMKSGSAGPAGVVAIVLVIGLQVAGLAGLGGGTRSAVLVGISVLVSRCALAICCVRGIPAARPDGLGVAFAGAVSRAAAIGLWLVATAVLTVGSAWVGLPWWRGPVAALVAAAVVGLLVRRTVVRFGGVTGDVFGAAIELAWATLLVCLFR